LRDSMSAIDGRGATDGAESDFPGLEPEATMAEGESRFRVSATPKPANSGLLYLGRDRESKGPSAER